MTKKYSEFKPDIDLWKIFHDWEIEDIGHTKNYLSDRDWVSVEGGLTFILKKGTERKKVIVGFTELGEWIEAEEQLAPSNFNEIVQRVIDENSDLMEDLAKGPKCDDKSCKDCYCQKDEDDN